MPVRSFLFNIFKIHSRADIQTDTASPVCPLFTQCGGCQYQDIPYTRELEIKQDRLRALFAEQGEVPADALQKIVPSPRRLHYRSRLDMKFLKTRKQGVCMGFSPLGRYRVVEVRACPLAMQPISDFLPMLKQAAIKILPPKYRNANLVVKTGDDGRVFWGGIGRRSLRMRPQDYLWTEINGRRVFYSLDTFFQANLSILPVLMDRIRGLGILNRETVFYDLYGGVGLFGLCLSDAVSKVVLVEENPHAVRLAEYNRAYHGLENFQIIIGRVEDVFPGLDLARQRPTVGLIDPPRKGLGPDRDRLAQILKPLNFLLYLSCQPQALAEDWNTLRRAGWQTLKIIPFDFFPCTQHLETLLVMRSPRP